MQEKIVAAYQLIIEIINYAETNKQTNEQWFLNFLDTVNHLSVSH